MIRVYIYLILILTLMINPDANASELNNKKILKETDQIDNYNLIVLSGPKDFLSVSSIKNIKNNVKIQKLLRKGRQEKSKYFAVLMDQSNQELYRIAIGDPFTIYAQHIGYENQVASGPNNKVFVELIYPSYVEPASLKIINSTAISTDNIQQLPIFK